MEQAYRSTRAKLILASKGLAMGTADIIPGVSGGTIALISGIYDHLIQAISSVGLRQALLAIEAPLAIFRPTRRKIVFDGLREIPWNFLLPLLGGIVAAMLVMVRVIPFMLERYAFYSFSFMFGLILFSISVPYRMMRHRALEYVLIALFAAAAFVLTGVSRVSDGRLTLQSQSGQTAQTLTNQKGEWSLRLPLGTRAEDWRARLQASGGVEEFVVRVDPLSASGAEAQVALHSDSTLLASIQSSHRRDSELEISGRFAVRGNTNPLFVFFSGAIAICAMILPGISGAYMLVVMGQYQLTLEALRDLSGALPVLLAQGWSAAAASGGQAATLVIVFVAGILTGILTFVRLLKWLLARWHSPTMAALTGLMIGSLRAIWPGSALPEGDGLFFYVVAGIGCAVGGAVLVFLLERASTRLHDPDAPIHEP
ncbi:MAG: DUF368 domain-containing protein [Leptospirales bacterium]|nr:DUF368 domain-containing protein [Leptospirales bacterium]